VAQLEIIRTIVLHFKPILSSFEEKICMYLEGDPYQYLRSSKADMKTTIMRP
jgi:hypothetical protein